MLELVGVETLEHLARNIFHAFFMSSGKAMTNTDNVHIGQLIKCNKQNINKQSINQQKKEKL